ncbi:DUF2496 domain-containing protein [Marinomonas agarivorans]|nr:DUF2496 domain-containing protein [Marinomonas agarivorans]
MTLEQAPDHIKLAVDLIEILESNDLEIETVVNALEIVIADFKNKQTSSTMA